MIFFRFLQRHLPPLLLTAVILLAGLSNSAPVQADGRIVFVNRARLSGQQIAGLENLYRVRIQNGRYWYDRFSGHWGAEGGPAAGQMHPGLNLGGPLRPDASGGGYGRLTGVFFNGRELHPRDVTLLQRYVPVRPGRYWIDARGNVGYVGGPALVNLYARAQQANAPAQGSSRSWIHRGPGGGMGGDGKCTYFIGGGSSYMSSGC